MTKIFDNHNLSYLKWIKHSFSTSSDFYLNNISSTQNFSDENIVNVSDSSFDWTKFFDTGIYSLIAVDDFGNISPAFTFVIVRDGAQPEVKTK